MPARCDHHADAAADRDLALIGSERRVERGRDALRQLEHLLRCAHVVDEDGELVAAQPSDRVLGSQRGVQALADRDEELVADRVTEAVVDGLEPVQVEEQQPDEALAASIAA